MDLHDANATPIRMLLRAFRRRSRLHRGWLRAAILLLSMALSIDFILILAMNPSLTRVAPSSTSSSAGPLAARRERIFIASMHWNNEPILRSHWNAAVLDLVKYFGPENVYVCITEGGSWDDTKGALRELDLELGKLGVERSVEMHDRTHKYEIERGPGQLEKGWIWTSRGMTELRRIPYLADIRNQVMDKLSQVLEGSDGQPGRAFDKVLWLNDVVFTTEDVTTLMATRDGKYAAACALDFSRPPLYYDTFALRDISGAKAVTQTWPFFLAARSRNAVIWNMPVPVKSCWNGLVVFQAKPFYNDPPLRFRGVPDSLAAHHLEGSECCLIHADNELTATHGVWLNPNVRVSYNPEASRIVNPQSGTWPSRTERVKGLWSNRLARWTGFPQRFLERRVIKWRLRAWWDEIPQERPEENYLDEGAHCMINEMQVLVENGWAHV